MEVERGERSVDLPEVPHNRGAALRQNLNGRLDYLVKVDFELRQQRQLADARVDAHQRIL
jgi:hypothetical protein